MKSAFFDWDTMPRLVFKGSVMSDYYCYYGKDRFFIYGLILYSGSVVNCTNWRHDSCHDDIFSMVIDIRRLKRY